MKRKVASRARSLMPEQVIAYLTYALEDVNVLSPRSADPLARAIALLTEDTLWPDAMGGSQGSSTLVH